MGWARRWARAGHGLGTSWAWAGHVLVMGWAWGGHGLVTGWSLAGHWLGTRLGTRLGKLVVYQVSQSSLGLQIQVDHFKVMGY